MIKINKLRLRNLDNQYFDTMPVFNTAIRIGKKNSQQIYIKQMSYLQGGFSANIITQQEFVCLSIHGDRGSLMINNKIMLQQDLVNYSKFKFLNFRRKKLKNLA